MIVRADWDVRSYHIRLDLDWMSALLTDVQLKKWKLLCSKHRMKQLPEYMSNKFENANTILRYNLDDSKLNLLYVYLIDLSPLGLFRSNEINHSSKLK